MRLRGRARRNRPVIKAFLGGHPVRIEYTQHCNRDDYVQLTFEDDFAIAEQTIDTSRLKVVPPGSLIVYEDYGDPFEKMALRLLQIAANQLQLFGYRVCDQFFRTEVKEDGRWVPTAEILGNEWQTTEPVEIETIPIMFELKDVSRFHPRLQTTGDLLIHNLGFQMKGSLLVDPASGRAVTFSGDQPFCNITSEIAYAFNRIKEERRSEYGVLAYRMEGDGSLGYDSSAPIHGPVLIKMLLEAALACGIQIPPAYLEKYHVLEVTEQVPAP